MKGNEPRACSGFARLLGKSFLKINGWQIKGEVPQSPNMVIIAAPHTSNWDFIYLIAAAFSFGISVNWLGKNTLFNTPLGGILRYLGGIAVDRSQSNNLVQTLVSEIEHGRGINLVVPPAGTRGKTDHWKSGFYRIAEAAQIPMVCGYLDYEKKEAGLGPAFLPSEMVTDMNRMREFYGSIAGKYPENKSGIRLREEDQAN